MATKLDGTELLIKVILKNKTDYVITSATEF